MVSYGANMTTLFLALVSATMVIVFGVDTIRKRHDFLAQPTETVRTR
jgi:hypothetical protein